jgi:hypothetical protein
MCFTVITFVLGEHEDSCLNNFEHECQKILLSDECLAMQNLFAVVSLINIKEPFDAIGLFQTGLAILV